MKNPLKIQSLVEFMNMMALKQAALWIGSLATAGNKLFCLGGGGAGSYVLYTLAIFASFIVEIIDIFS